MLSRIYLLIALVLNIIKYVLNNLHVCPQINTNIIAKIRVWKFYFFANDFKGDFTLSTPQPLYNTVLDITGISAGPQLGNKDWFCYLTTVLPHYNAIFGVHRNRQCYNETVL